MGRKRKSEIVKKSNALIRSHWTINSIWEPRIVALIASKIQPEDEDFKTYRISISELIAGTDQRRCGRLYNQVESAIKQVMSKTIEIYGDNPRQKIFYSLFGKCLIDEEEGYIEVRFDSDLKPHFLDLKERFTLYSLAEFMKLPSTYSQRLFEILSSWRNSKDGEVTISMEELHKQLDTPLSQRKNFKEFRVYVLEQAQKDILANPDASLDYEWEPIKKGRKVIAVRFIFDRRKVEAEREAKIREAQKLQSKRNNEIFKLASQCSKRMAALHEQSERDQLEREQNAEVCLICKKMEMCSLFPPECRRYAKVEIVD